MCKIENENCTCELFNENVIMSLNCKELTNQEFFQNFTQLKREYILTEMFELNLENKLIKNISNSNVKEILTSKLISLAINNCKIQSISKGIFNHIPLLLNLSLTRNEIDSIEINSFSTESFRSKILEFYLSMNKLTKIKYGQFTGLISLQTLFIDKNLIEEIELKSFDMLSNLVRLNMKSNKIKMIKSDCLSGLDNLEIINLDTNQIEEIEMAGFKNFKSLRELNLHSNKLKVIHNKMFVDRADIVNLYLYQNEIESLETIPFNLLFSLEKLHLFSNKITHIKFGNFIHAKDLKELKLDKNEIRSFDATTFIGLENLIFLDLSANKIRKLVNGAFDGLTNVTKIKLDLNDIEQIETNAFINLERLQSLALDSNQISSLKNVQFNPILTELSVGFNFISNLSEIGSKGLKILHISNNRIQEINTFANLPNLEYLDLYQNRLISLKEISFSSFVSLKYLNLSCNRLDLESEFDNVSYFKNQTILEILDLSTNLIKHLNSNKTLQYLDSLKSLNLSKNKFNTIQPFVFGFLCQLNDLNLASNNLRTLNKDCFFNLAKLEILKLSFNQLNSLEFLRENRNYTKNLKSLDLDNNRIEFIGENDFEFIHNLTNLNLNSNPIKTINENAFYNVNFLTSLKLSNNSLSVLRLNRGVKELDLSYLSNGSFVMNVENASNIEWINLSNTKINISFDLFISNLTKYLDYSFNSFTFTDFKMFNVLGSTLETLKLRETNLQNVKQINFQTLINLKHLDLSFNNLTELSQCTFEFLTNLEYLDLSSNRICEFFVVLNRLKYLNLDNNQIFSTSETLFDYYSIETFKMANNRLQMYPSFEMSEIDSKNVETFTEIDLNKNQLNQIKYFSFVYGKLQKANFDMNNISSIETDAFLNCRTLEYLSIAQNRLKSINENNFHFLFGLIQLNLSFNQIELIENASFKNLNKLKSLDLNYNKLFAIQNDLFLGLENLKDLHLMSQEIEIIFNAYSFKHLPNISSIYLNERSIVKHKCLFMHEMERDVQRSVPNKYVYYKSINLISKNDSFKDDASLKSKCDLVFHLFQFKLHLNLKTDYENDLFFDTCQNDLIARENNFNHNKRKCVQTFLFKDKEDFGNDEFVQPFLLILSNFYFLLTLAAFFSLLGPVFCLIMRYELFSKVISYLCKNSLTNEELAIKELKREIAKKRRNLGKKLNKYQESNLTKKNVIKKDESNLFYLEEKLKKLQFISTNSALYNSRIVNIRNFREQVTNASTYLEQIEIDKCPL
jgi:Leucine-rich repeat (LRR) protein